MHGQHRPLVEGSRPRGSNVDTSFLSWGTVGAYRSMHRDRKRASGIQRLTLLVKATRSTWQPKRFRLAVATTCHQRRVTNPHQRRRTWSVARTSDSATSRCCDVCGFPGTTPGMAIVGFDRRHDRFGRPVARPSRDWFATQAIASMNERRAIAMAQQSSRSGTTDATVQFGFAGFERECWPSLHSCDVRWWLRCFTAFRHLDPASGRATWHTLSG